MKAMILAAGHGTRMKPLTDHTPKPLLKVGGKPLIVWHIEKLKKAGFKDIIINIAWLGDQIPKTLGDGSQFGVNLHYSDEQKDGALETAGGIIKALSFFDGKPFLVVNGDVWCDYEYCNQNPLKAKQLAHLVLVNNPEHNLEGDFALNNNTVKTEGENKYTFSGIGYYHPNLFKKLPQGKRPLAPLLREAMGNDKVSGEHFAGDWRDIGTPERLTELDQDLSS
ncbi:MAG: nucleotidyltransferase family protein [Cocleimonas sp.]|nr:nucleotidyltransferase family protein [Cocleimonas sp.]